MRAVVYACAEEVLPRGCRVLDAGCGAGLDTEWLIARGFQVTAIDASAGMVAETQRRAPAANARQMSVEDAGVLVFQGRFEGALMNFGVLNCVDLRAAARALAQVIVPGGALIAVHMPRVSPSWTLSLLLRGHPREALRRLRPELDVVVEGAPVRTRYLSVADVQRGLGEYFNIERIASLGLLLPPPGTDWPPERLDRLNQLEGRLRHLPVLRGWGDHVLTLLRRNAVEPR